MAHPLIHELHDLIRQGAIKRESVVEEAATSRGTLNRWFNDARISPRLLTFDRVLKVLGYKLAIVKIEDKAVRCDRPECQEAGGCLYPDFCGQPEPEAEARWRPIENAPKDGTRIIVWRPKVEIFGCTYIGHVGKDRWVDGSWWESRRGQPPSHWMPLPEPPR